ncbi:MAG: ATP synthase subunit I [Candidimonas sp.]
MANQVDGALEKQIVLSDEQRLGLRLRASAGIMRTLYAQAGMGAVAIVLSWLVAGKLAALSALIGAGAYLIPNAVFALRLLVGLMGPANSSPFTFFVGEAFKLGMAVAVLGAAGWLGRDWLVWPAMLAGLLCVLKGYVVLLALRKLP